MTELSKEYIEDAFAEIRAKFENKKNITGLEILANYEDQWQVNGRLSDRQIAWIEKQLDGSWQSNAKLTVNSAGNISQTPMTKLKVVSNERAVNDADGLLDAMIQQKLKDEGKAIIDLDQLDALAAAVDKLRSTSD